MIDTNTEKTFGSLQGVLMELAAIEHGGRCRVATTSTIKVYGGVESRDGRHVSLWPDGSGPMGCIVGRRDGYSLAWFRIDDLIAQHAAMEPKMLESMADEFTASGQRATKT